MSSGQLDPIYYHTWPLNAVTGRVHLSSGHPDPTDYHSWLLDASTGEGCRLHLKTEDGLLQTEDILLKTKDTLLKTEENRKCNQVNATQLSTTLCY